MKESNARKILNVVSSIQEVIDNSGLDSDELYFAMRCIKSLNCYESEESRDVWMVQQGTEKAIEMMNKGKI